MAMSILVDQQKAKSITTNKYKKLMIHSSISGGEEKNSKFAWNW